MSDLFAIVVAAGAGARLQRGARKAAVPLGGRPLVVWSLETLAKAPGLSGGVLVVHPEDLDVAGEEWLPAADADPESWQVVAGGGARAESVRAGLRAADDSIAWILVHEAARPLIHREDVERVLEASRVHGAAILASRVVDTLWRAPDRWIEGGVTRDDLWRAETPQVARREWFDEALAGAREATDEAELLRAAGKPVRIVESLHPNLKVTLPDDLVVAERLISRRLPK